MPNFPDGSAEDPGRHPVKDTLRARRSGRNGRLGRPFFEYADHRGGDSSWPLFWLPKANVSLASYSYFFRLSGIIMPVALIVSPIIELHVQDGEFRLEPSSQPRGWPDVITAFLQSLTQNWDGKLIAVIVSGFDGDGVAAFRGTVQPDMPAGAIASGFIDFIFSPEDIGREIARIVHAEPADGKATDMRL